MTTSNLKIRIYDLAKELKLESKRVLEEVRREGIDVNVPSNTISKELAEKIRNKYFPKKETSAPRIVRVVKKAVRDATDEEMPTEMETAADSPAAFVSGTVIDEPAPRGERATTIPTTATATSTTTPAARPMGARLVKKLAPATRAERPAEEAAQGAAATVIDEAQPEEIALAVEQPATADQAEPQLAVIEAAAPAAVIVEQAAEQQPASSTTLLNSSSPPPPSTVQGGSTVTNTTAAQPPAAAAPPASPSRQIRVLRPTSAALNAGVRHGERAPVPVAAPSSSSSPPPAAAVVAPAQPTSRERRERGQNRGGDVVRTEASARMERGTPGETATPQRTYIPPPDARRPRPRAGAASTRNNRGGKAPDVKTSRFDRDFVAPPRTLSLEDRIAGSLNTTTTVSSAGTLKPVRLVEGSTVKEFAEKLGIKPKDIVALLMQRGMFPTINQPLNDEVATELGQRFGYEVTFVPFEEMVTEQEFEDLIATDTDDVEVTRAPVVTVMGHVDHGKTSLLDAIRTTEVAAGEAGGITQHIGAYSVNVPNPDDRSTMRRVVFLDTPGHEAFTMMRARGAKATDVVVLVVAADDGVMPQTIEAIEHARAAGVPLVVAINKIDKPDANPDRAKQGLATQGLQPIDWGGDTEMVLVSARRRENLDMLLETILLTADILNLKASPTRLASGVVLEAKLDRGRGAVATVLVQQGTLHVGDPFIAGQIFGKVRAMFNDRGESTAEAGPATPVEVLGLQGVPQAGETFQVVADVTRAQSISQHRQMVSRQNTLLQTTKRGIEALGQKEVKELLVVLKADVQGSVEVLKSTLQKLSANAVKVKVIRSGVGAITESDVLLASATQAGAANTAVVIIGFNVRPEVRTAELAKQETVDIRLHSIIYKVEEEIRAAMLGMLDAVEKERILGHADVREVFRVPKLGAVAGSMVTDGIIRRTAQGRLIRDGVVVWDGQLASLRRFKEDASEVRDGFECGIGLQGFNDIKVHDQIEAYVVEKVAPTEL